MKALRLPRHEAGDVPLYPVLLVAAYVLTLWIDSGVSFFAILRALGISVGAVSLALIVLALLTRRPHIAAAVVIAAFGLLMSRGVAGLAAFAVLLIAVAVAFFLWARARRRALAWSHVTGTLNVLAAVVLAVVLVGGIPRGSYGALVVTDLRQGAPEFPELERTDGADPSFLVILLDGYPRADALEAAFGYDNAPFIGELERRGFDVATRSASNYPYTQATLISLLHMRPLHEISALDRIVAGEGALYPLMRQVANDNPVFDEVRERGYVVVTSSPGYEHVTLRQADVFLDNGSLNEPERHLIRGTTLQWIIDAVAPDALADQHRQRILAGFRQLEAVTAHLANGPTFAFLHIPSPHMPVVLGRAGDLLEDPPSDAIFRSEQIPDEARAAYVGQLQYLNEQTLRSIDGALSGAPAGEGPIIVVLSDHGAAPPALPGESWTAAHYASFLAVRTPSSVVVDLPMDATPVNLFPRLLEAAFGSEHTIWPDEAYPWVDVPLIELGTP